MSEDEYQKRLLVETKRLREQNAEFVQQRNTAMQRAYDLARAMRVKGPSRVDLSPYTREQVELALKEVALAQGIGTYQAPQR